MSKKTVTTITCLDCDKEVTHRSDITGLTNIMTKYGMYPNKLCDKCKTKRGDTKNYYTLSQKDWWWTHGYNEIPQAEVASTNKQEHN